MDLETYLAAIKACPDDKVDFVERLNGQLSSGRTISRLTYEWGVYDNFPILIRSEVDVIVPLLTATGTFVDPQIPIMGNRPGEKRKLLHYSRGTIRLQTFNGAHFLTRDPKHAETQKARCTMGFTLHPYQEKKVDGVPDLRVMAWAIEDIGMLAKEQGISLCFPRSVGWSNLGDFSQVVYLNMPAPTE